MNNEKYNQIIDEAYGKYLDYLQENDIHGLWYDKKNFIKDIKNSSYIVSTIYDIDFDISKMFLVFYKNYKHFHILFLKFHP